MKKFLRYVVVVQAFCSLTGSVLAQEKPLPRIGFVAGAGGYPNMAVTNQAFFDGLAESKFIDGTTMRVIFRSAEGDMSQMPRLVSEVLAQGVDFVVVSTSPGCSAAKKATSTVPVLCISVQEDPVTVGLATTQARGSGNLVGVHSHLSDGIAQQLTMLMKLKTGLQRLGILFNPKNDTHVRVLGEWERTAKAKGVLVVPVPASSAGDLAQAIDAAKAARAEIALGLLGADTYAMRKEIANAAVEKDLPIVMDTPGGYTRMGGVATIGVDIVPLYRRSAIEQMVPMLRGVPPSELPWIGPTEASMKVNKEVATRFKLRVD